MEACKQFEGGLREGVRRGSALPCYVAWHDWLNLAGMCVCVCVCAVVHQLSLGMLRTEAQGSSSNAAVSPTAVQKLAA